MEAIFVGALMVMSRYWCISQEEELEEEAMSLIY